MKTAEKNAFMIENGHEIRISKSDMKILVTGGSGMVGRNLIESNIQKHHDIVYPSSSELNLINQRSTNEYIKSTKPDLVIHCAGKVGGIQANIENPVDFLFINNLIGFNLIDAALSNNVTTSLI